MHLHMVAVCISRATNKPVWWVRKKSGAHNALYGWQGLCFPGFQDKFPFQCKLVKGQQRRRSVFLCYISILDLVRKRNSWAETSATGPTSPKHWITQWRLHEGVAQPNGGLADTLVYGNRHRGFDIWALIFSLWWRWKERIFGFKAVIYYYYTIDWLLKSVHIASFKIWEACGLAG